MLDALRNPLALPSWVSMSALPIAPQRIAQALQTLCPQAGATLAGMTASMADKRRNEFMAGRLCAAQALLDAGAPASALPADRILRIDERLPVWPAGWRGSISHARHWAVAAVAGTTHCAALGLDLQDLIDTHTMADVQSMIATEDECRRLAPWGGRQHGLTLLFSAKEALYKALYPRLRAFQEFDAAELTDAGPAAITLTLTRDWDRRDWRAGRSVAVRYAWADRQVLTVCCVAAGAWAGEQPSGL
ncbi:phosphopantetheinyltransferase component of enterobactin synthase multienzyme complex [Bordetella ansorpii]|uniref:Enterobactin synthase component D n=2 Tax=Bordetella ansorpii TaxID=288768 RepID=A0A157MGR2_9BORD|nr:phosphopantetheinyltransferase component of enterobactin synthase multienzyme complex [Bordetella ansorpii]